MLLVYLGLLALGGGIIAAQLLLGHDTGGGVGGDGLALPESADAPWGGALFLSLRFWSFSCLAAGLCGSLCLALGLASGLPLALLSAALGLASGAATSLAMRALLKSSPPSSLESQQVVGQVGRLLLAPKGESPGKVRLLVGGHVTDLVAVSDDAGMSAGDEVLVLALRGARVEVTRMEVPPKEIAK